MRVRAFVGPVLVLLALCWLWPNLVHEPLHIAALEAQGSSGAITFDWGFPAHPFTQRTAPVAGIPGGLFFLLLPSIVSGLILVVLWKTRKVAIPEVHGSLGVYLAFDLAVNLLRHGPISDFRFLGVLPFGTVAAYAGASIALIAGMLLSVEVLKVLKMRGAKHWG